MLGSNIVHLLLDGLRRMDNKITPCIVGVFLHYYILVNKYTIPLKDTLFNLFKPVLFSV